MKLTRANIRATSLEEFWGDEYEDFRYLWKGTLHTKSLSDINLRKQKICDAQILDQKAIESGHLFCKDYYFHVLPVLANTLNTIHRTSLDQNAWGIAFGYWLYRHISIIYDKYLTLVNIDLENSSIKLLDEASYYIPKNHSDYIFTFANDFGVQQLVSLFYRTFSKKEFSTIHKNNVPVRKNPPPSLIDALIVRCYRGAEQARSNVEVVLLGTFFSKRNSDRLKKIAQDRICNITLPDVNFVKKIDFDIRKEISKGEHVSDFDKFFWRSLEHCLPTVYLEDFNILYHAYRADILARDFKYIASESWISDVQHSIYIAVAKHFGKEFIAIEHAAGNVFLKNGMHFIDLHFSDKFVTTGWSSSSPKVVTGGFMSKDITIHQQDFIRSNILFVTFTRFIYWEEFNEENATDSFFLDRIEKIGMFVELLPLKLANNFLIRPRSVDGFWNVEGLLSLRKRNIKIDCDDYSKSIRSAKIVIIDHMSTGFAELLQNRVPFILLYNIDAIPLSAELESIFDQLKVSGLLHTTPASAVEHLVCCYPNFQTWWDGERVQAAVLRLKDFYLHPADETIAYLNCVLNRDSKSASDVLKRVRIHICEASGFVLRALRMVGRLIGARLQLLGSA